MREQNALPYGGWITVKLTAKDDVDNVGAGRAAKGANPSLRAKNMGMTVVIPIFFLFMGIEKGSIDGLPVKKELVTLFRG